MNTVSGEIHDEHPFLLPPSQRDPARRLRGRLTSGVTVVTAFGGDKPAGLTVASVLVAEGEPARLLMLVSDTTDFWYALEETGRFVLHVCDASHRTMADRFAGVVPAPGGPFTGVGWGRSDWGPVISGIANVAFASVDDVHEVGWQQLVVADLDRVSIDDLGEPLVWFRGAYRSLG